MSGTHTIAELLQARNGLIENNDALHEQLADLREENERKDKLIEQGFKTLDRVHCMWAKRLLDATGIPSQVLIPDEEFVKYFEELKGLKRRLGEAELLLKDLSKYQTNAKGWQERVDQFLAAGEQA